MHESAKVLTAICIASVLTGIAWGLQLKRMDAEGRSAPTVDMSVDVGRILPVASETPPATVIATDVKSAPEKPVWKTKDDGSEYLIFDRSWTLFRSIDPITARPIRQACGYDAEWLSRRVCIGGPFGNVTFRAVNEPIDFDVFGQVPVEVRFDTARGPVIRTYMGLAASQWDGIILNGDQAPDFLANLSRARGTVIRFKLTEGFAVIRLTREPKLDEKK